VVMESARSACDTGSANIYVSLVLRNFWKFPKDLRSTGRSQWGTDAGRRIKCSVVPAVSAPTVREAPPRNNYFVLLALCYSANGGEEDGMRSPPLRSAD